MCKKCLKMRLLFAAGGFVVGALAGAGTAALVARKKIKEQNEIIEDLLEENNKYYDSLFHGVEERVLKGDESSIPADIFEEDDTAYNEMQAVIAREGYGRIVPGQKPSLEELARIPDEEQAEEEERLQEGIEEDEQVSIEDYENGEEGEDPHEITAEEFLEDQTFDKDQLTFYTEDETLCDSDDTVLNIDNYLNYAEFMEAVEKIMKRHKNNGSTILYWRNPAISCDFEIEIRDMSYTATVLGVDDSEQGGYKRSKRRRQEEEDE